MTDPISRDRVVVQTDGTAGPYIIVHESQVDIVRKLLTSDNIQFEENPVSIISRTDAYSIFDLGHRANIDRVQARLDSIP